MWALTMSRVVLSIVCLFAALSNAKPWQGIHPGVSSTLDVFGKFGEPTKKADVKGQLVLVYSGIQAPGGTVQTQFKLLPGTQTVGRIDVYPAPQIDKAAVEKSYGPKCDEKEPQKTEPCYFLKESEGKRPYFLYLKLGVAVFFKPDGSVLSFAFLPGKE